MHTKLVSTETSALEKGMGGVIGARGNDAKKIDLSLSETSFKQKPDFAGDNAW